MSEGTPTPGGAATDEGTPDEAATVAAPTDQQSSTTTEITAPAETPESSEISENSENSETSADDATTIVALPEQAESGNTGNGFAPPAEVPLPRAEVPPPSPEVSPPVPVPPAEVSPPVPVPSAAAPQGWATPAAFATPTQQPAGADAGTGAPQPLPYPYPSPYPYLTAEQPPKPKRHFPWRWVGAAVVTLAVGTGCAFAVMAPKRTDLPGLATAADGRYTFAPLSLPTLAPGQADPTASANAGGQHIADIRKLLLPAPEGAVADHSLPGATGWVSLADTLTLLGASSQTKEQLSTDGWRHTAGVAWTTPDGADTKIYLAQFIDSSSAGDATSAFSSFAGTAGVAQSFNAPGSTIVNYTKSVSGSTTTWYGDAQVADTEMLIVFKAPNTVGIAPFEQESTLQIQLLQ